MNETKPDVAVAPLTDPVCGMTVTVRSPHVLYHGGPVYFCGDGRCGIHLPHAP